MAVLEGLPVGDGVPELVSDWVRDTEGLRVGVGVNERLALPEEVRVDVADGVLEGDGEPVSERLEDGVQLLDSVAAAVPLPESVSEEDCDGEADAPCDAEGVTLLLGVVVCVRLALRVSLPLPD